MRVLRIQCLTPMQSQFSAGVCWTCSILLVFSGVCVNRASQAHSAHLSAQDDCTRAHCAAAPLSACRVLNRSSLSRLNSAPAWSGDRTGAPRERVWFADWLALCTLISCVPARRVSSLCSSACHFSTSEVAPRVLQLSSALCVAHRQAQWCHRQRDAPRRASPRRRCNCNSLHYYLSRAAAHSLLFCSLARSFSLEFA